MTNNKKITEKMGDRDAVIGIGIAIAIFNEDRDRDRNFNFGDRAHALP